MVAELVLVCWSVCSRGGEVSCNGMVGVRVGVSGLWCTSGWAGEGGGSSDSSDGVFSWSASGGPEFSGTVVGWRGLSSGCVAVGGGRMWFAAVRLFAAKRIAAYDGLSMQRAFASVGCGRSGVLAQMM